MRFYSAFLSSTAALCLSSMGINHVAEAFNVHSRAAVAHSSSKPTLLKNMYFADEDSVATATKEQSTSEMAPKKLTVYERLGFNEDQIAIGINPNEVLQWLGNRDDIVEKFTKDNKGMDADRIQQEVDKFMMDREMVESFIAYEKKKADPRNLKVEAEANLSDPSTWGVYAVWIAGGAGFAYVKNVIVEPKYASGEWQDLHITLPLADRFAQVAADAASSSVAVDAAASASGM